MNDQRSARTNGSSLLQYVLLGAWVVLFAANFMLHDSRGLGAAGDSFGHLAPATRLVEGLGYSFRGRPELVFPPGYGLSTLPLYLAGFELIQAALIINVIALAFACLFTYLICRFYVSRLFALVAILFVITNSYIMGMAALAMSEATFMAAISGAGYFVLRFIRQPERNPLNLAVAGAFVGWAALTRPEGMGIALALLAFLWVDLFLRQPPPRFRTKFVARLALYGVIFAAPATAMYAPYAVFLSKNLGHFALSAKSEMNLAVGNAELHHHDWYVPLDPPFSSLQRAPDTLRDDALRTARNLVFYARHTIKHNFALLISLSLVLAVCVWRNKLRILPLRFQGSADLWEALGFCVCMLLPVVPIAYHMARTRLLVPYDLFVVIGAVVLMDRIVALRSSAGWRTDTRLYAGAVAVPLILLGTYSNLSRALVTPPDHPLQTAAVDLASLAPTRPVNIMAIRAGGMVTYYANDRHIPVAARFELIAPDDTPDTLAETMQAKGLQYLVLDRYNIRKRPKVASLWTCPPDSCFGRLRLVAEKPDSYRIFELVAESPQTQSMAN